MPPVEHLLAFTVAAFLLIVVPGPSVVFIVGRALAYGRRVAVGTAAGNALGSFALAGAVAFGLGPVIQASATVYTVIKLAGAGYLVYLGARAFRHRRAMAAAVARSEPAGPLPGRRAWSEGFVVGVTNPKAAVFFAAVLPQFIDRGAGHPTGQLLVLAAVYTLIALLSDTGYGVAAGMVRRWFAGSRRRLELIGGGAGLTMIGLGVAVAATGRRE